MSDAKETCRGIAKIASACLVVCLSLTLWAESGATGSKASEGARSSYRGRHLPHLRQLLPITSAGMFVIFRTIFWRAAGRANGAVTLRPNIWLRSLPNSG